MIINIDQLRAGLKNPPDNLEEFIEPINEGFAKYHIDTDLRIAAFLGQASIETDEFRKMRESMFYKHHPENEVPRLYEVFRNNNPRVFSSPEEALLYEENSEKCANKVYANKLGNGNEASGHGYKYRGGGLFHLTGRGQYNLCGVDLKVDLINNPEQIEEPRWAVLSACWFWNSKSLNRYADNKSHENLTKAINAAKLKLKERIASTYGYLVILERK